MKFKNLQLIITLLKNLELNNYLTYRKEVGSPRFSQLLLLLNNAFPPRNDRSIFFTRVIAVHIVEDGRDMGSGSFRTLQTAGCPRTRPYAVQRARPPYRPLQAFNAVSYPSTVSANSARISSSGN
jgi:hypothetical protein